MGERMDPDSLRTMSLDGWWDFYPGDHALGELDRLEPETIMVPGLWEAQGWIDLDGTAWCRRRFSMSDANGDWTLRFGAVMDMAAVYLNGSFLGVNELPYTPFEFDAAQALVSGENDLAVKIVDPSLTSPDHVRMPHGKQGWANEVFPSPPSLYMTYGGIWQPVTLRRHGPVMLTDVFVNGDPDNLVVTVEVENRGPTTDLVVGVRTLGSAHEQSLEALARARSTVTVHLGATSAARWGPGHPALHEARVDVCVDGALSDTRTVRYGLRTVALDGDTLRLNGRPYRMKSVLVQGFRADTLYAEGSVDDIRSEVAAALSMGFNTLRLHLKAFDPAYLDVCDGEGMLLHCDLPVGEPIVHDEMGSDSLLVRRSVEAVKAQVRRDRNHPSIVLWSAMNEICEGRYEARRWPEYESFARTLAGAVDAEDATRPVIENDWVEPDPDRVFVSPILTAHWYGRLHREYLDKLDGACRRWRGTGRPLYVTEFGDWGLPDMPVLAEPTFWDTRARYVAALAQARWPTTVERFADGTQRYQGIADRLQGEVFRRHPHVGGYCLTELTDVPQEFNGVLDIHRRPKRLAVDEIRRLNQAVLPMLQLASLVVVAGDVVVAPLSVANDGDVLPDVTIEVQFGDSAAAVAAEGLSFHESAFEVRLGNLAAHTVTTAGEVSVVAPDFTGSHDLVLRLRSRGRDVSENRYPIHLVRVAAPSAAVRLLGAGSSQKALQRLGVPLDASGVLVVAENGLDESTAGPVRHSLADGETVVVLAQPPEAAPHYPVAVTLEELITAWGSTAFRFTTDHDAAPSLPRRSVLVAEDYTVQAVSAVTQVEHDGFPDTPVVIVYKPVPDAMTGTVLGSHAVGPGRLVLCQYRLAAPAASGDAAACAILADVLTWASQVGPTHHSYR